MRNQYNRGYFYFRQKEFGLYARGKRAASPYNTARGVGYPDSLFAPDNNTFGPRIGVAFKITNNTVLRGSYGEYFWTMPLSQLLLLLWLVAVS